MERLDESLYCFPSLLSGALDTCVFQMPKRNVMKMEHPAVAMELTVVMYMSTMNK